MKIWLSSDYHFNHDKPFIWESRGFNSVEEMNEAIVERNNELVSPDDTLIILGDIMLGGPDKIEEGMQLLNRMNGDKLIILGNHDTDNRKRAYTNNGLSIFYAYMFNYKKYHFYLSHYPTLCSNYDDGKKLTQKTLNLCGHSHYKDPFADWDKGCIFHVEVDGNNCYPWALDDIIKKMTLLST